MKFNLLSLSLPLSKSKAAPHDDKEPVSG